MKRLILSLIFLIAVMTSFTGRFNSVSAVNQNTNETFLSYAENSAGRYFTSTSDGIAVLELIPAFGRLFASVGYYMGERSLYSYYAAELIPVCQKEEAVCSGNASGSSFDVVVRFFSNMSMAGEYWPGETRQRLTLIPDGLLLSNYSGNGDALISKENTLLKRNGDAPGMFPYGSLEAGMMAGNENNTGIPAAMTGVMSASWQLEGEETIVQISLEGDGTMLFLRDQDTGRPPLLLKGGYSVREEQNDSWLLCYLMSSPSSGMMPYNGCTIARIAGDTLVISDSPQNNDDLLLPDNTAEMVYVRDSREENGR